MASSLFCGLAASELFPCLEPEEWNPGTKSPPNYGSSRRTFNPDESPIRWSNQRLILQDLPIGESLVD